MNRYKFSDILQENPDGSLSPRVRINVNGVTLGTEVTFRQGVAFGGIDFFEHKNQDTAAEEQNGILIIRGFYK